MVLRSPADSVPRGRAAVVRAPTIWAYRRVRALAGNVKRTLPVAVSMMPRIAQVSVQRLLGRSDYGRWSDPESLEHWWVARTQKLATLIPPQTRVLEFGAGRCQLQQYLDSSCSYFASDLTPRGPDTILCDLNRRPLPDLQHLHADIAVFGGVLEYVRDLPSLAAWLAAQTPAAVASYDYVKSEPGTVARMVELFRRSYFGYLNHYTLRELASIFAGVGLHCVRTEQWTSQKVMLFAAHRAPTQ